MYCGYNRRWKMEDGRWKMEDGRWIRIYPVPFRKLDYSLQFKKYDWIEIDLKKNESDFRPESFRPVNLKTIKTFGHIPTDGDAWLERRKYVLTNVYTNLDKLIAEAKDRKIITSIATFKPTEILNFKYEPIAAEWELNKLKKLESMNAQGTLFDNEYENDIENFEVVDKLPYKFTFEFKDDANKTSKLMIEDWETGMLYWNSLKRHEGDEMKACQDVKKKYYDEFAKTKDYYLFLGTTKLHHYNSKNPFVIIGDFRPNFIKQESLF